MPIWSQSVSNYLDLLRDRLENARNAPERIRALCELIWEVSWSDPELTLQYQRELLQLIGREKDKVQLTELFDAVALAYWINGDLANARNYYEKALNLGYKVHNIERIAWESYNLALLSFSEDKIEDVYNYAAQCRKYFQMYGRSDMIQQCDVLLKRARRDSLFTVVRSAESETLIDQLSLAESAIDSAIVYCWTIWRFENPDRELILQYGSSVLDLVDRIHDPEKVAEIYDAAALAYRLNDKFEESIALYKRALSIGLVNNLPVRIAWDARNLASLSIQMGNFADVKKYALMSRKAFLEKGEMDMVVLNDWYLINANFTEYVDTALIDTKLAIERTDDPNKQFNHYFNMIRLYGRKENKTHSMRYAMKALEIAEAMNNQEAILSVYCQIAEYLRDYQKNYETALLYYNQIIQIYQSNDDTLNVAGTLIEIGNVQTRLGNDSLALDCYQRSLDIVENSDEWETKVNAYKNIGEIYFSQGQFDEALRYFLESYRTGRGNCSTRTFHSVLIDLGKVYLAKNDSRNALMYLNRSLNLADSVNADYETAVSYSTLADLYQSVGQSGKAIRYYHTALNRALDAHSLSLQKDITHKLSGAYSENGHFEKAYVVLAMNKAISDSLNRITAAENLSRLETKFEFQNLKIQQENEIRENRLKADAEIRKQSQMKYFFIAAFLLSCILVLVVYSGFRRKKNDSQLLEQQKRQIEEMSGRVHVADQRKLSFFTNISHEFRTPLTLILGLVEKLIKEKHDSEKVQSMLATVHRNGIHLYHLINQLLDIRRMDAGNVRLNISEGDILNSCGEIFSNFSHTAAEKGIDYRMIRPPGKIICWFDHDILEKILYNLLSNAFKYTPQGGKVTLNITRIPETEIESRSILIVIADNGKGIPEEQIQYVFDRYYQVENIDNHFNIGSGIGLAYTKELVELHKGEINVKSGAKTGTIFTVRLPVHESCFSDEDKISHDVLMKSEDTLDYSAIHDLGNSRHDMDGNAGNTMPEDDSGTMYKAMLLIVEDNEDLRKFICSIFDMDYQVKQASEGESGYQMALESIPDIVISDIMMPGMDGLELCQKIKTHPHTSHIPVLLLTARAGDENELEGLNSGADDYIQKPFNSDLLKARVQNLLVSREKLRDKIKRELLLTPREGKVISPDDVFLEKCISLIEDNINNHDLNIDLLIQELNASRVQVFRKIKALTGYTPNQLIRNIRLKRAAQMLDKKSFTVSEVLFHCGFNSPSYFSACFRELYGCTPKEYILKVGSLAEQQTMT